MARLAAFDMDGTLLMPDHHLGKDKSSLLWRDCVNATLPSLLPRGVMRWRCSILALSLDAYLITGNGTRVHSLEGELLHRLNDLPADVAELVRASAMGYPSQHAYLQ